MVYFKTMEILYEDNHIIVVNKAIGEIVQADPSGDEPLEEKVREYIRVKYNKPGEAFLGVVHRIDRPVSGVVLMARTSKALARLNEMMATGAFRKTYMAIVKKNPIHPLADSNICWYVTRRKTKVS